MSTYEPIMNALAALLEAQCGSTFLTYSRRFVTWEDLLENIQAGSPIQQPALYLFDGVGFGGGKTKFEQRGRGRPPVRILYRTIVIYARLPGAGTPGGPDATTAGGTVFAPLTESVEAAFQATDSEGTLTLGGLVSHCWIEGESYWLTGDINISQGGQGMLTIPVMIMIP